MTNTQCPLCYQVVSPDESTQLVSGAEAHIECLLRASLGGIGHIEDHAYWCNEVGDPDGGRSYRQSALEVAAWVRVHGMEAALRNG
jgi:hypothetical protein